MSYDYLNATQVKDSPFIVLGKPVRLYKTNYQWNKEKGSEQYNLPRNISLYLLDETKAPYEKVLDGSGNEISNLVYFNPDGNTHKVIIDGDEREVTPVDYNFFNFPAEISVDGKPYKRKWLDAKVRVKAVFLTPCEAEVWDKELKQDVKKLVTHAKLDIPAGTFSKIEDKFETVKETKENPDMQLGEVEIIVNYDDTKPPAECYSVNVKPTKAKIDAEKELDVFAFKKTEFEPPAAPF